MLAAAAASVDAQKSVNAGVYTAEQATRGEGTFGARCTNCHDPGRFTGNDFVRHWSNQPLAVLYGIMSSTMPEDNPGSLTAQEYADVLAYFLSLNKYPAGVEELKGGEEAMKALQMEPPKAGGR